MQYILSQAIQDVKGMFAIDIAVSLACEVDELLIAPCAFFCILYGADVANVANAASERAEGYDCELQR